MVNFVIENVFLNHSIMEFSGINGIHNAVPPPQLFLQLHVI